MSLTVRQVLEDGREALGLQLVCGEAHLDRVIQEEVLNRPGLALAGFTRYFAFRRIQVFGLAEMSYLKQLTAEERADRLQRFFQAHVPCLVLSRHLRATPDMRRLAERFHVPLLRTAMVTSRFIQQATLRLEALRAPRMRYQGTMVDIMGIGVIIEGPPGVGKSETALGLVMRGHSLVADDLTDLQRTGAGEVQGKALEATRYHMEIRGLGIIHVSSLFGVAAVRREKRLDAIVRLERALDPSQEERTGLETVFREVLGVPIPCITIRVAAGRDITNIVETAALNLRLKLLGHDAVKELDARLMKSLGRPGGPE